MSADVVEGTATPVDEDRPASTAIARVEPGAVLMPMESGRVIEGMRAYQSLLHDLLDASDWQETSERGPDGQKKRFPKKSAWRKIGRAFSLSTEIVPGSRRIERAPDGSPLSAECVVRVTAPNGQTGDGDGYCSLSEFKGRRREDPKLENTMRATATTRAKNRAIADLVGMGEVSAEEIAAGGEGDPDAGGAPGAAWYGQPANDATVEKLGEALAILLDSGDGPDEQAAGTVLAKIAADADAESPVVPRSAARAILFAAAELRAIVAEQEGPEPEDGAGDHEVPVAGDLDDHPDGEGREQPVAPASPEGVTDAPPVSPQGDTPATPEELDGGPIIDGDVIPEAGAPAGDEAQLDEDFGLPSKDEAAALRDEARESSAPAPRAEDERSARTGAASTARAAWRPTGACAAGRCASP